MEEHPSAESLLQRECVICKKNNLLGNVVFYQLSCGHFVHLDCWSGHAGDCPVCDMSVFKTGEFGLINVPLQKKEPGAKKRWCCFCLKCKK